MPATRRRCAFYKFTYLLKMTAQCRSGTCWQRTSVFQTSCQISIDPTVRPAQEESIVKRLRRRHTLLAERRRQCLAEWGADERGGSDWSPRVVMSMPNDRPSERPAAYVVSTCERSEWLDETITGHTPTPLHFCSHCSVHTASHRSRLIYLLSLCLNKIT